MADFDIEQFKEQEAAAEKLKELYDKIEEKNIDINSALEFQLENQKRVIDALREEMGAQADLLRMSELQQKTLEDVLAREEDKLRLSKELQRLQKAEKVGLDQQQQQRLAELKTIEKSLVLDKEELKELEKQVKTLKAKNKELDKINATQKNVDALLEREFKQRTGLVTSSQSLAQEMARIAVEGGNSMEFLNGAAQNMNAQLTKANLLNSAMAKMGELGQQFNSTMLDTNGLLMEMSQADIRFVRDTGLTRELGNEVRNLRFDFNAIKFTAAETDQAFRGLTQSFTDFTEVTPNTRRELTENAAVLERFGVQSDTTGKSLDGFTKAMGKTPQAAMKSTKEMVKFARALGVGPNKLLGDLNQNFEIFAEFGMKKGVEVFKKLQTAAKQTGIEFGKLTGIIDKFDQSIEGTMEAAGDLNFFLGGPFINSMELLEAEGPEKFEILRSAVEASGKSFDQFGRFQKRAIAGILSTDVETAARMFKGTAGDIDAATAAVDGQAAKMQSLNKEAKNLTTLQEEETLVREAQAAAMKDFAKAIEGVNRLILELKQTFAPLVVTLGAVATAAGTLFNGFMMYKTLFGGGGAIKETADAVQEIGDNLEVVKDLGEEALDPLENAAQSAFDEFKVKAKDAFESFGEKLSGMGKNAGKKFGEMKDAVSDFGSKAFETAKGVGNAFMKSAGGMLKSFGGAISKVAGGFVKMAGQGIAAAGKILASFVTSAVGTLTAWVTAQGGFMAAASAMIAAAAPIVLPILAIGAAIAGIVIFWDELVGAFSTGFDFLKDAFSGYLGFIKSGFKMFLHGMVIFAEVIAHALTLPFTAIVEGAAAVIDLIPGMDSAADAARSFSPGRIIRTYASEIHASIDSFEKGTDGTKGGAFIAGDSTTGPAKPEMVVAPPMSSVINNKNLETLASLIQNNNQSAGTGPVKDANINVTLKLGEREIASMTEKMTKKTVMELLGQGR